MDKRKKGSFDDEYLKRKGILKHADAKAKSIEDRFACPQCLCCLLNNATILELIRIINTIRTFIVQSTAADE